MVKSLRLLLDQAIDYAGLFPPAALDMASACTEYAAIRKEPYAWLVRKFVCPIHWLPQLLEHDSATTDNPWEISVIGTSLENFSRDLDLIEQFEESAAGRACVTGYEVKGELGSGRTKVLKAMSDSLQDDIFVEVPQNDSMLDAIHQMVEFEVIGAKLRTGGLEASAFPTIETITQFIHECVSLDVPFKFTAGLHHPFRTEAPEYGVTMHGFINLLMASCLAQVHDLTRTEISKIIGEPDLKQFWFTEKGAGWKDFELSLDDIESSRELVVSWGSCSVTEPLEDLIHANFAPANLLP